MHYTLYTIQYTQYTIQYTQYTIQYTQYTIQYTLYTIQYTQYTIHFTLCRYMCRVHNVHYTVYTFWVYNMHFYSDHVFMFKMYTNRIKVFEKIVKTVIPIATGAILFGSLECQL